MMRLNPSKWKWLLELEKMSEEESRAIRMGRVNVNSSSGSQRGFRPGRDTSGIEQHHPVTPTLRMPLLIETTFSPDSVAVEDLSDSRLIPRQRLSFPDK